MNLGSDHQPFVFTPAAPTAAGAGAAFDPGTRPSELDAALPTSADPLVQATVREIADIVREVAIEARSDRSRDDFLAFFVDRVLRAMAAEGVIVWRLTAGESAAAFEPVRSIGRLTEASIPEQSVRAHQRLLSEISIQGQPVVVPATPGATDADVPANPMDVPVAVLGIENDPTTPENEYLLEVFLDPEGGVATQRGYLRFAAQMADLAGEFMRTDQLRQLRRSSRIAARVDHSLACLHQHTSSAPLEAQIVDLAAEVFQFDQVALCYIDGGHADLAAVSHVNQIDRRSPSAKRLIKAAESPLDQNGTALVDLQPQADGLSRGMIVGRDSSTPIRLVALTKTAAEIDAVEHLHQLQRFVLHADLALTQAHRWEAIPGARWLASLAPTISSHRSGRWLRPVMIALVLALVLVVAMFPLPLIVSAPATVRPDIVQSISLPRDAIVQQVHVQHGQVVMPGDLLITLVDPQLEREITELIGRRAVLAEKQSRLTSALVETPSSRLDQNEQLLGQQRLASEEIASVDQQLTLLTQIKDSLVIHADRRGVVDGWRLQQRLAGRPLRRGDHLLAVVAEASPWIVEAQIPQNRLAHVRDAFAKNALAAEVVLDADSDQRWQATLKKVGPSSAASAESVATTAALLNLDKETLDLQSSSGQFDAISGAPAQVVFDCGSAPVAYLLFQDLFRNVRGSIGLYFGAGDQSVGEK